MGEQMTSLFSPAHPAPEPGAGQTCRFPLRILIVDDEINIRKSLTYFLEDQGHTTVGVSNPTDAKAEASLRRFDLALVDVKLGAASGLDVVPELLAISPWMKILMMTGYCSVDTAVKSIKAGSIDYLSKPVDLNYLGTIVDEIAEIRRLEQGITALQEALGRASPEANIVSTTSPDMQRAIHVAQQVARTNATVLIRGESGTGKGVLVKAIHSWSTRSDKTLTTVSCPSLSGELLESELFGHVKGAFTSALRDNPGRVAMCEGGTLFLDEIGDLPLAIQPKFLRFIQEHEYERVGEQITRRADVRIITATNVDLNAAVAAGRFREDLLYRLNVIQIEIPPLRARRDDIVPMAERMLAFFTRERNHKVLGFTTEAAVMLRTYSWPGNVRELRNVIERCAILATGDWIGPELLPTRTEGVESDTAIGSRMSLEQLEEMHIRRVLASTKSLDEACAVLGINAATLWRRRKQYGI
jgi:two-component system, NtrC family, response regulator AlgB